MEILIDKYINDPGVWHDFSCTSDINYKDNRIELIGPIDLIGKIKVESRVFSIKGSFTGKYKFSCERCDSESEHEFQREFDEEFTDIIDEDKFYYSGDRIILDDMVTNIVLLGLVMQLLCKEDCKGICSICYVNNNYKDCEHTEAEV